VCVCVCVVVVVSQILALIIVPDAFTAAKRIPPTALLHFTVCFSVHLNLPAVYMHSETSAPMDN
jgi:hypothetical protein